MAPARNYDVIVSYSVQVQQSHIIVEGELCGELIKKPLAEHSSLLKEVVVHLPVIIFIK